MTTARMVFSDSAANPIFNAVARSVAPTSASEGDIYLDDGTNTTSTDVGWMYYNGTTWEDLGGASGGGAGAISADTLVLNDGSELTIATDAITVTKARHTVDTEADAASDDLVTINGLAAGEICIISASHTDRTVVVKNSGGNIACSSGADISLDATEKEVLLYGRASTVLAIPLYNLGSSGGGGTMDDFTLAADSGTPETVADGNTLSVLGGTGIDTVVSATDTVTIAIDSTVTTLTGAQTLTNKILSQLQLIIGGFKAIFTHSNSADRTYTLPNYDGSLATVAGTETFTNKTIDADGTGNVITNIGSSEVKAELITGLAADATPDAAADYVMTYDASATALKKVLLEDLPSGGSATVQAAGFVWHRASTTQPTISVTTSWSTVPLSAEENDPDDIISVASNQINMNAAADYILGHVFLYVRGATTGIDLELRVYNVTAAVEIARSVTYLASGAGTYYMHITGAPFSASLNDKVEVQIKGDVAGTLTVGNTVVVDGNIRDMVGWLMKAG